MRASQLFLVWTILLRKEDQEWWLSKSDNSNVGLSSAMKNTNINGLHKTWACNHTVVALKCEVNRQETTENLLLFIIVIVKNNLHQSQKNDALLCLCL